MGIAGIAFGLLLFAIGVLLVFAWMRLSASRRLSREREAAEEHLSLLGIDAQPSVAVRGCAAKRSR